MDRRDAVHSNQEDHPERGGIGGEIDAGGVGLGASFIRQDYNELIVSPNDIVSHNNGSEWVLNASLFIFNFEISKETRK